MRKDKCLFCNSKNCIIRIACEKHKEQLKQHASNKMENKELVVKETTGPQKRGENI